MHPANLDFSDEEDVPDFLPKSFTDDLSGILSEIQRHVDNGHRGEMIREGIVVAIVGRPNVGKSSLLNLLAARDVAIVTDVAGTTRDLLQVDLDIGGYAFQVIDTAGLRETESVVEAEGIRRARELVERADIVLHLDDSGDWGKLTASGVVWCVSSKSDVFGVVSDEVLALSSDTGAGVDELLGRLSDFATGHLARGELQIVTRERHTAELRNAVVALELCSSVSVAPEFRAEFLRSASDSLGRIVGAVDIEDVLDRLFAGFCIGK